MIFKKSYMEEQFGETPVLLQLIAFEFEKICKGFKIEPVITRVTDIVEGSSGVHEAGRAFDIRDEHPKKIFVFEHRQRIMLIECLNSKYSRKDKKPTILWHSFKGGLYHFHIQVSHLLSNYKYIVSPYEFEKENPYYDA